MNLTLQNKLFKKYPKIFRDRKLSPLQTCMCWGIDCGDGWYKLLNLLCNLLQYNTDNNRYPQVVATQVKEKYGTLRFYYTCELGKSDATAERQYGVIDGMVEFSEQMSAYICEHCGSMEGVSQTKGWIVTLCKKCMKERTDEKSMA